MQFVLSVLLLTGNHVIRYVFINKAHFTTSHICVTVNKNATTLRKDVC